MLRPTSKTATPNNTIYVDGVPIAAQWSEIGRGTSFFIPCVNSDAVLRQVRNMFDVRGWKLQYQVRTENNYFGIRIWRTM